MKISYQWLLELTGLEWPAQEMASHLTNCGTALEEIDATDRYMEKVVVGVVNDLKPIEGADKIRLATVDTGSETMDLVCGAPNVAVGQKVPVALLGAKLAGDFVIKKVKIRGILSCGMICSERELGISDDHAGIMVLDSDAPIGEPIADYLDFHDYQLTFELTPNRPDSMSAIGIARDAAGLAGVSVRQPEFELTESSEKTADYITVKISDPDACPRYAARVIKNVKIGPSPWWIQKRLLVSGIRPINNVVDITNYVLLETGHPLHAFDYDRFGSKEVVVRRAAKGEKFKTLDGQEHDLIPDVLLISNGKNGVAAGGVMGGLDSEVEDSTTNVLLEAAYFDPSMIRKSRRHLGFVTESSTRFEKGADPNRAVYAIDRAVSLMHELCGGEVLAGVVDCYPREIKPRTISLRPKRCNAILGTALSTDRMRELLTNIELEVAGDDRLEVTVPTFRPDLEREIDLIEEVARMEGWANIPDAITNVGPLFTPYHQQDRFLEEARTVLTGAGFNEMINHGLVDSRLAQKINPDLPMVKIVNPSSSDLDAMRHDLLLSTLVVVGHNISHRNINLCLFEIGTAYLPPDNHHDWREDQHIVVAVTGNTQNGWRQTPRPLDFHDVTGALDHLVAHFRRPAFEYAAAEINYLESGLAFEIKSNNAVIGSIGQVTARIARLVDIKQPVFVAEFSTASLLGDGFSLPPFKPLPQFPAAPRDLAMIVAADVPAGELVKAAQDAAGPLAEEVSIFDLYTGKQIEQGKKSIALAIIYRSPERSLSGQEVDAMQQDVVAALIKKFNAEIRDK
ncbi:MAG: phenylalanine--tRNA ligase subunit beta [candidate division Zixibacteria bacterium]|nr:phenylalanine--tRNA ligase subunit beta [candidate division Zixibacteria bacterium]